MKDFHCAETYDSIGKYFIEYKFYKIYFKNLKYNI